MDIKEIPVDRLRGYVIGFFTPMNGGKTETLVNELERAKHSGFNIVAYGSTLNTRDSGCLQIDERIQFPAVSLSSIKEIKEDLENRLSFLEQNKNSPGSPKINYNGVEHSKGLPLLAVGIDEANLFTLSERTAQDFVEFLPWIREKDLVLYVSGLEYDFRDMNFGNIDAVIRRLNVKIDKKPACKAIKNGKQCGMPANHTQRVWLKEFASEIGCADLIDQLGDYDFASKEGNLISDYVPAPFFDKTVRIEQKREDGKHRIAYLPTCWNCAKVPFKNETFTVYNAIIKKDDPTQAKVDLLVRDRILNFLLEENWVERKEGGFTPINYHKNQLGGYSPH